jgi:predicted O-linked N-acetylglucosamine transferase (SPINDLY family)
METSETLIAELQRAWELHRQKQYVPAEAIYRKILAHSPRLAMALFLLGRLELDQGRRELAAEHLAAAVQSDASKAIYHATLARARRALGRIRAAIESYRQAIDLEPDNADYYVNLGNALLAGHETTEAEDCYKKAIELDPQLPEAYTCLGVVLKRQGRLEEAVAHHRRALTLRPVYAKAQYNLGTALLMLDRPEAALESFRAAADLSFAPAIQNLGYLLIKSGRLDEGMEQLERAQQLEPADVNRVMLATALPVVYESVEDVCRRRERLLAEVDRLLADGVSIDTTCTIVPTTFFAAYQGFDDCELQRKVARLYRAPQPVEKRAVDGGGEKIRVGFLSSHFWSHTIGRLNLGRVKLLDRERFDVTLVSLDHRADAMADEFCRAADHVVQPRGPVDAIRDEIAGLQLDVLVFADVGMNITTYTLAMSRLAGTQCVTWGHPVTTGNASMDYFISSQWLETPEADAHYTERLVRLANLGTYYYRPQLTGRRTRESFGLDPRRSLYLCPQTLFKIHPEFDAILAGILRGDPSGEVVFIAGSHPQWTQLLGKRFERTLGDLVSRVRFLPPQPNAEFLHLCALADVLLDTIHFGGGNTSYEGLAVGTPIVTLPGAYLRGRITQALYRKMGLMDCVVVSPEEYVDLAVRLGSQPEFRGEISQEIQSACGVLFEDPDEVREVERFLAWAAAGGKSQWRAVS